MTLITDNNGTRWVEIPQRARRKPRTGGRFSEIAVGDHLVNRHISRWTLGGVAHSSKSEGYVVVTDLWFDPVEGEENPWKGQMVGVAQVRHDGSLGHKQRYSRHALAAVGFHKTDVDFRAVCLARAAAFANGNVVGIGQGRVIRKRPKLPGHRL